MSLSRRHFIVQGSALAAGFVGLQRLIAGDAAALGATIGLDDGIGYGPLTVEPMGVLELPRGFRATVLSRTGETMDDGFLVPGMPDGMAAFPGEDGRVIVVRNHELEPAQRGVGPFGRENEMLGRIDAAKMYDAGGGVLPALGGTTTLVINPRTQTVERQFLSLAGTIRNCAGGPTPWGTWLTCEEDVSRAAPSGAPAGGLERDHGYVFEVPATAEIGLADPTPILGMGRFFHEAVAVDPRTGIVYLTEDRSDGLLYRYVPREPGRMLAGGRLQALAVQDRPSIDTRNWGEAKAVAGPPGRVGIGEPLQARWIDVDDIDSPNDDLRQRGFESGAARFARGEGMWYADGSVYFCCTNGGHAKRGQVWRLTPGRGDDGGEGADRLELFVEPNDESIINMCDNLTVAPWGDLILCEDGTARNRVLGVTPEGRVYVLARSATGKSEFAGATFSPDGETLLVHAQQEGLLLAITGPWRSE